ncbi:MAG TPA: hypothetical protein PKE03_01575 [Bacteroidales bacterium]|nr:hypothetical protein [Bacteroidales bacterium]
MRYWIILLMTLLVIISLPVYAQRSAVKQESERKIGRDEFPAAALSQLDQLKGQARAMKYYREISNGITTFEAKFNWLDSRWSLEFDSTGRFIDLEKDIPLRKFKAVMNDLMHKEMSNLGFPYRILKAQQQYSWAIEDGRPFDPAIVEPGRKGVRIRLEVEIEVKSPALGLVAYELLMEENGHLLQKRMIIPPSNNHLLY